MRGSLEVRFPEDRTFKVRSLEISIFEMRGREASTLEMCFSEMGTLKVRAYENGILEVRLLEASASQICRSKVKGSGIALPLYPACTPARHGAGGL